jgi:hypothetical protein
VLRGVRPRHNVCLLFAPRERNALSDPDCDRHARYRELFLAQIEHFHAAGAAPARVFEYWFDAILFSGGVPDLAETMAEDLGFYRDAGAHTVQMLITGNRRSPSPHPKHPRVRAPRLGFLLGSTCHESGVIPEPELTGARAPVGGLIMFTIQARRVGRHRECTTEDHEWTLDPTEASS